MNTIIEENEKDLVYQMRDQLNKSNHPLTLMVRLYSQLGNKYFNAQIENIKENSPRDQQFKQELNAIISARGREESEESEEDAEFTELKRENAHLQQVLSQVQVDIKGLETTNKKLEEKGKMFDISETKLEEAQKVIKELRAELTGCEKLFEESEEDLKKAQKDVDDLENEKKDLEKRLKGAPKEKILDATFDELKGLAEQAQKQFVDISKSIAEARKTTQMTRFNDIILDLGFEVDNALEAEPLIKKHLDIIDLNKLKKDLTELIEIKDVAKFEKYSKILKEWLQAELKKHEPQARITSHLSPISKSRLKFVEEFDASEINTKLTGRTLKFALPQGEQGDELLDHLNDNDLSFSLNNVPCSSHLFKDDSSTITEVFTDHIDGSDQTLRVSVGNLKRVDKRLESILTANPNKPVAVMLGWDKEHKCCDVLIVPPPLLKNGEDSHITIHMGKDQEVY